MNSDKFNVKDCFEKLRCPIVKQIAASARGLVILLEDGQLIKWQKKKNCKTATAEYLDTFGTYVGVQSWGPPSLRRCGFHTTRHIVLEVCAGRDHFACRQVVLFLLRYEYVNS